MTKQTKLPEGWQEVELGEIATVDSGQGAPQGENYFQGKHVFIRAGDLNKLTDGIYAGDFCGKITDEAIKEYSLKKYKKDSIVFPKSGMSVETGNMAILKYDSYIVNHLAVIEPSGKINYLFLFYFLKRISPAKLSKNPSYPSIRISDIKSLKIVFPPLATQKKIVQILERAESLKQNRDDANKLTKDYLQSVFYEMFKDIKLQEFNNEIFEIIDGDRGVNYPHGNDFSDEGYCLFLNTGNVRKDGFNFDNLMFITKEKDGQLRKGKSSLNDVILTTRGTVGNVAVYNQDVKFKHIRINSGMVLLRPNLKKISPAFLFFLIQMPIIQEQFKHANSGTAQPQLPIMNLRKVKIPLPPLPLQQKFAKIVERVEKLTEKQKQSKDKIDEMFNSLMQRAFNGELVK